MAEKRVLAGYRSGEIARKAGVSTDTLRHYERKGLLPTRRLESGYRTYPPEALDRFLLIQRALAVGFTLHELSELLRARDHGRPPCREVRALAERKLAEVDEQLENLARFREELVSILRNWDVRLAAMAGRSLARLLESLASRPQIRRFPLKGLAFDRRRNRKEQK